MHTHSHPPRGIHRWHVVALAVLLATVLLLAVSITPAAAASDAGAPVAALHPFPAQNAPRHAAEAVSVNDGDVAVAISIPAFFLIMTVALFAWAHHNKVDRTAPPSGDDAAAE